MIDLQTQLANASDWKAYRNVVAQCEKRKYYVPEKYKEAKSMHVTAFAREFLNPDLHEPLLLHRQCMVVSKIDASLIPDSLARQTDCVILPDINKTISTIIESKIAFDKEAKSKEETHTDMMTLQVVNGRRHL